MEASAKHTAFGDFSSPGVLRAHVFQDAPQLRRHGDGEDARMLWFDEALLEEAVRVSGERTYSRAIERALQELVRRAKAHTIFELAGSGAWRGDRSEMRGDRAPVTREAKGVSRTRKRRAAR